ncbi:Gfo/Idh/MocA family protein [Neorhizobium sp. DT-125]|uniref:Gfo/Idh/MocA family protein n=1 Tax=Neorhizobium sp. DT-125 TaxID=3396163 RepID=UPI003F1AC0FC
MAHRVAIVGTGAFAKIHADALLRHEKLALAGFAGARPDSSKELAAAYGVRPYRNLAEVLDDNSVTGVIIATPHDTHLAIGRAVLEAGKCILIEKPLAITVAECDLLIEAERQSAGRAMVGHLMGLAPAHVQARILIEKGVIGDIVTVDSRRMLFWNGEERRPWQKSSREGGGMWLIQGVHVIDQVSFLLSRRAEAAYGVSETRFNPEQSADDFGLAHLRMGDVHVNITIAGTGRREEEVHTQLYGTRGNLRVSHRGELRVDTGNGWEDRLEPVTDHWKDMIDAEMDCYVDLIEGRSVSATLDYGRYIVAVLEAVRRSAASRREEAVL